MNDEAKKPCFLFIIDRSSLVVHRSSFIAHHSSLIVHRSSFSPRRLRAAYPVH
jgi:hypothetical protein